MERGSPAYEAARTDALFNTRYPARYPVAVLEAASEADVVAGVLLAKERGWRIAARSGGHAWAGWSVRDDALLIDLGGLREMTIDVENLTATVSPSMRGGQDLAPFLRPHGLVFPGGHCSTVGLGGYLLQGGRLHAFDVRLPDRLLRRTDCLGARRPADVGHPCRTRDRGYQRPGCSANEFEPAEQA